MIKIFLSVGILMISNNIHSQEYKSILLDYSFNPNTDNLIIYQDSIYFSSIGFFSSTGGTVIRSLDKNLNGGKDYFFDGLVTAADAFSIINNQLYVLANSRVRFSEDMLLIFNDNKHLDTINRYTTDFDNNLALQSQNLNGNSYLSWLDDHSDGDRSSGVRKVDRDGNILWKKNFHVDEDYSLIGELDTTYDGHLLVSNDIILNTPEDGNEFYGQVKKIDQDGNLVWEYTTDFFLENSSGQWLVELSNRNIVLGHRVDKADDPFFTTNSLDTRPEQLTWIDKDGNYIQDYIFRTSNFRHLDVLDIVNGKGDYFFVVGNFGDGLVDGSLGVLLKFSNEGEIIWNRSIKHPAYETTGHSHFIENLVELDNGDLITLGITRKAPELAQVWLMKLNSEVCLSETNCGKPLTLAAKDAVVEAPADLFFPNPSDGIFMINEIYSTDIKEMKIFNLQGALIYEYQDAIPAQLDLRNYASGVYTIQLRNKEGAISIAKVVKH